ncbi:uncharacterized protein LOC110897057 [Helianthus annuus]|uniref:uncharacterized protein LOC110897057 n=1 Tax=Helianthus annuus TaxID=4232 RepID=UPI000B8F1112|nr:uncharacterized protein LOC110897057 [Helianthus annuus]
MSRYKEGSSASNTHRYSQAALSLSLSSRSITCKPTQAHNLLPKPPFFDRQNAPPPPPSGGGAATEIRRERNTGQRRWRQHRHTRRRRFRHDPLIAAEPRRQWWSLLLNSDSSGSGLVRDWVRVEVSQEYGSVQHQARVLFGCYFGSASDKWFTARVFRFSPHRSDWFSGSTTDPQVKVSVWSNESKLVTVSRVISPCSGDLVVPTS